MPPIEQQIAVRIKNFVEGLPQVQALSAAVLGLSKANAGSGLKSTAAQVVNLGNVSNGTVKTLSNLYSGFQTISKGFANGSADARKFTADLGNVARQQKAITDQSRLLNPASSTQLPARNPVFQILKPLVDSTGAAEKLAGSTAKVSSTLTAAERHAEALREAYVSATAAGKKLIEQQVGNQEVVKLLQGFSAGGGSKPGAGFTQVAQEGGKAAKAVKEVGDEAGKTKKAVGGAADSVGSFLSSLGRIALISAIFSTVYKLVSLISEAIHGVIDGIKAFTEEGIRYNATLETSKISLASLIATTSDIKDENGKLVTGADAFHAALDIAGKEMTKIQAVAIATRFEFEDILQAVTLATAAVGGTNVTLSQTVSLVEKLARAAAAVRLNPSQFQTQVRQILTGATRVQTTLATAIFPGQNATDVNKQIKQWREAGTLVENLNKRLEVFGLTANEVEGTFDALSSNVVDAFKKFAGEATFPLFEKVKTVLNDIIHQIVIFDENGVKLTPTFQKLANILAVIYDQIGVRLVEAAGRITALFDDWVSSLDDNKSGLRDMADAAFEIGKQLALWVVDILDFLTFLRPSEDTAEGLAGHFRRVALLIAFVRDIANIFLGTLQTIVTGPMLLIVGAFELIGRLIDQATFGITKLGNTIGGFRKIIQDAFFGGISRIADGATFDATRSVSTERLPRQGTRDQIEGRTPADRQFNAFPRPNTDTDGQNSERAAREQLRKRRQLLDALAKLQETRAKQELELSKATNDQIRDDLQDRYNDQLISATNFYKQKQELDLADIAAEEKFLNKRKQILTGFLKREVGNVFGLDEITTDALQGLVDKAAEFSQKGSLAGVDSKTLEAVKLIVDYNGENLEITTDLKKLELDRQKIVSGTTAEIKRQSREVTRMVDDIDAELADSFGNVAASDAANLAKRISDQFKLVLLATNPASAALTNFADIINRLGDVSFEDLIFLLDAAGIKIEDLSPATQKWLKLMERKDALINLSSITGELDKIQAKFQFDLSGVEQGFDLGDSTLGTAIKEIDRLTDETLPQLQKKYQELQDLISKPNGAFTEEDVRRAAEYGRAIDAIKAGSPQLSIIAKENQRANDELSATLDAIAIKRENYSITSLEADQQGIAAKELLIAKLNEELAAAEKLNQTVPENIARVRELINQIGTLRNEVNTQTLEVAHGIEDAVGGAIQSFFDTILQGNESILTSFRRVVAGMLAEIAKLIFQAFVLKQIMSLVQGVLGGVLGGGGGASGSPGVTQAAGPVGTFADGGIVSGPGTGVSDSIPAMLSHGEAVIPARSVNAYGRGLIQSLISGSFIPMRGFARFAEGGFAGGSGGRTPASGGKGTRIVNIVDKSFVSDFLNSSEGEEVIVNIIGRNRGMLQRLV